MVVYIALYAILCVFGFVEMQSVSNGKNKTVKVVYSFAFIIVLAVGVFREINVGNDANSYYDSYWSVVKNRSFGKVFLDFIHDDFGFYLITKVIQCFTTDYWVYRAILYVVTFTLYFITLKNNSRYICLSLLIFLSSSMLNLMFGILRQALAGAICFFAYNFLKKNRNFIFIILVLLATTIHKTAIISLFLICFKICDCKKINKLQLSILMLLCGVIMIVVFPVIVRLYGGGRYSNDLGFNGGIFLFAAILIEIFVIDTATPDKVWENKEVVFEYNVSCMTMLVQVSALFWALITRTRSYYSVYFAILIPNILKEIDQKNRMMWFVVLVVGFGVMFFKQIGDANLYIFHHF